MEAQAVPLRTEPTWELLLREFQALRVDPYYRALDACESPIERMMLLALINTSMHWGSSEREWAGLVSVGGLGFPGTDPDREAHVIGLGGPHIVLQLPVEAGDEAYRLDFGLRTNVRCADGVWRKGGEVFVAIECDGHEFHERTTGQAQRDKKRDRDLQSIGWHVARFTGSEIVRSPHKAAETAWALASGLVRVGA